MEAPDDGLLVRGKSLRQVPATSPGPSVCLALGITLKLKLRVF